MLSSLMLTLFNPQQDEIFFINAIIGCDDFQKMVRNVFLNCTLMALNDKNGEEVMEALELAATADHTCGVCQFSHGSNFENLW